MVLCIFFKYSFEALSKLISFSSGGRIRTFYIESQVEMHSERRKKS